jgi:dTDP-4-dehydrorhamnose reductase
VKRKLLVTGSAGFVAGSVITQALESWEVHALDRVPVSRKKDSFLAYTLNLTGAGQLEDLYNKIKPDALIHLAAIADIDYCQNNQKLAGQVNVGVTANLARLCRQSGSRMIFCSTDTVFDGQKGFYNEEDQPHAVNFYAETKIRAERLIQDLNFNAVITRLSLVMGLPVMGSGNSFLARMIEKLQATERVPFPQNEIRTPIDVITLGQALLELAGNDFNGIIHLAGNEPINRYEMACRIADRLGYPAELVTATDSNAIPGRATRPNNASLDNRKAGKLLKTKMNSLEEGLDLTLNFGK